MALTVAATATTSATAGDLRGPAPPAPGPGGGQAGRHPADADQGRVVLGVGVGSHAGEYEQSGIDYHARGRLLDAGIAELRRSWATGDGVTVGDTEAGGSDRYRQLPGPQPIPVWVGGSSEAALRRAATLADGWMPLFFTPNEYREAIERLAKEVDRAGRPADAVTPSMVLFVSVDDDPRRGLARGTGWMSSFYGIPAKAFERHLVSGTAAEVADVVAALPRCRGRARGHLRDRGPTLGTVRAPGRRPARGWRTGSRIARTPWIATHASWAPP